MMVDKKNMRSNYQFDYSKARPNRFAGRALSNRIVVMLDPDVSKVFKTPESVNTILRALISGLPKSARGK
jgi:hypothetical protein